MADAYRTNQHNGRVQATEYERPRGKIADAKGTVLADSQATGDSLKYQRTYPGKDEYAQVLGYKPVNLAATASRSSTTTSSSAPRTSRPPTGSPRCSPARSRPAATCC